MFKTKTCVVNAIPIALGSDAGKSYVHLGPDKGAMLLDAGYDCEVLSALGLAMRSKPPIRLH